MRNETIIERHSRWVTHNLCDETWNYSISDKSAMIVCNIEKRFWQRGGKCQIIEKTCYLSAARADIAIAFKKNFFNVLKKYLLTNYRS